MMLNVHEARMYQSMISLFSVLRSLETHYLLEGEKILHSRVKARQGWLEIETI